MAPLRIVRVPRRCSPPDRHWPDRHALSLLALAWRQAELGTRRELTQLREEHAVAMYEATKIAIVTRLMEAKSRITERSEAAGAFGAPCIFRAAYDSTTLKDEFLENPDFIETLASRAVSTLKRKQRIVEGLRGLPMRGIAGVKVLRGPEENTIEALMEFHATLVLHVAFERKSSLCKRALAEGPSSAATLPAKSDSAPSVLAATRLRAAAREATRGALLAPPARGEEASLHLRAPASTASSFAAPWTRVDADWEVSRTFLHFPGHMLAAAALEEGVDGSSHPPRPRRCRSASDRCLAGATSSAAQS